MNFVLCKVIKMYIDYGFNLKVEFFCKVIKMYIDYGFNLKVEFLHLQVPVSMGIVSR